MSELEEISIEDNILSRSPDEPEGILQILDRLEDIVDNLLVR